MPETGPPASALNDATLIASAHLRLGVVVAGRLGARGARGGCGIGGGHLAHHGRAAVPPSAKPGSPTPAPRHPPHPRVRTPHRHHPLTHDPVPSVPHSLAVVVTAVVFDVGETLIDDTREWGAWADWLGVPAHTVSALVGAVTARGLDNSEALRLIKPDLDLEAERTARENIGRGERIEEGDLYPDVRSALTALRHAGI